MKQRKQTGYEQLTFQQNTSKAKYLILAAEVTLFALAHNRLTKNMATLSASPIFCQLKVMTQSTAAIALNICPTQSQQLNSGGLW